MSLAGVFVGALADLGAPDAGDIVQLVLERLRRAQTTVLDGEVRTTPAGQYVVLYDDAPRLRPGPLAPTYARQLLVFRIVCAGRNPGETRDAVSWVLSRLAGWTPVPEDRSVGVVAPRPDGAPILPDRSVPGDVRFSQTLVFHLATSRSS